MMLDCDRDHVRSAIGRSGIKPIGSRAGHPVFDFVEAVKALFSRRGDVSPELLSPTDRKNLATAHLQELELAKRRGDVLPREEVQQACATAFNLVAQALRAIPDNLERRLGIAPELADEIGKMIDDSMGDLADELERIHLENAAR